jgi:uncharacterized protein with HEPN domain
MAPEEQDAAYLWDMLQAAREAVEILGELDARAFKQDKLRCRAIERTVEIIGEAARKVSRSYQTAHPEIPWRDIIGQRNILAHEYGQLDHGLLYKTVRDDIPQLVATLSKLLPPVG